MQARDKALCNLGSEIHRNLLGAGVNDPFAFFLYGIVISGESGRTMLLKSLRRFPFNWDAWMVSHGVSTSESDVCTLPGITEARHIKGRAG